MKTALKALFLLCMAAATWAWNPFSKENDSGYDAAILLEKLDHPWSMVFLPDNEMLISERSGSLVLFSLDTKKRQDVSGVPDVFSSGQGGLLGLTLDPDFKNNQKLYFCYSAKNEEGLAGSEVSRAVYNNGELDNVKTIFRASPKTSGRNHYGCRLQFDDQGYLLISLGDRFGFRDKAQELDNHLGKIVRIDTNGSVPADNPFTGSSNAVPEIYSLGHRNVQGLTKAPDGSIWAIEHGPRGGDELNLIRAGENYGWPKASYGVNYTGTKVSDHQTLPGMVDPVAYWVPSIAPSGMTFYTGDKYPEFSGNLFIGALKHEHLRRIVMENNKVTSQQELLGHLGYRIRDVKQGPDGFLYLLTDHGNGKLLRLEAPGE